MNTIKLSYTKKTSNKYSFITEINGKVIGDRDYTGTKEDHKLYSEFVDYMQMLIDKELVHNPNFTFKNVDEFRAWANSSVQRSYLEYIDSQTNDTI